MTQTSFATLLTDDEAEYLCELITPREIKLYFQKNYQDFTELKRGYRAMALSDQQATELIVRNRNKNFVAEFLDAFIKTYRKEVHDNINSLKDTGITADTALIQALAYSNVFSSHVELYFKFEESPVPEEQISLINAAVTLLCEKSSVRDREQSSNVELTDSLERVQRELTEAREARAHIQENLISDKLAFQQELERKQDELSEAIQKMEQMQAELDRFHRREAYADILQENEAYKKYQHTSLCQVTCDSYGQVGLKRLVDIDDNHLTSFRVDKSIPYGFENRDMLYRKDGPSAINFIGIWRWNTISENRIDSAFDARMAPIEIFVLPDCTKQEDIAARLLEGLPSENLGKKR